MNSIALTDRCERARTGARFLFSAAVIVLSLLPQSASGATAAREPGKSAAAHSARRHNRSPIDCKPLLKKIFPDIKGTTAHKSVTIRNLHSDYEPCELDGEISVDDCRALLISNGNRKDIVLVINASLKESDQFSWGGLTLLALFRQGKPARLLDLADVKQDRESGLYSDLPVLRGRQHDAIVVYGSHLNAGEDHFFIEIEEIVNNHFVTSKIDLPMVYSAQGLTAQIAENISLQMKKKSAVPTLICTMKATAKSLDQDTEEVTGQETRRCRAVFTQTNGRWHSASAKNPFKTIGDLENKYGFAQE